MIVGLLAFAGCRSAIEVKQPADGRSFDLQMNELLAVATEDHVPLAGRDLGKRFAVGKSQPKPTKSSDYPVTQASAQEPMEGEIVTGSGVESNGLTLDSNIRLIALNEVLQLAVDNSDFVIDNASFLSPANPLLNDPQFVRSNFDVDLLKSSQQSVDAALANFETTFASGAQWGRNSIIQANNNFLASRLLVSDNGTFYGRLDKPLRSGGAVSVIHNLNYASQAQSIYVTDPRFSGYLRSEFRQPLLSGRGRAFTDIAGPLSYRSRQQGNGVALAEIAEHTAVLDFQLGRQRIRQQAEELYWDCWLAGEVFANQQSAMENAQTIWQRTQNRAQSGLTGGGVADEAQAEENYHHRKSLAEAARIEMEQASDRLKHALGLSPDDGTQLVATDRPSEVPRVFELVSSLDNGLANRKELRKQDLQIQAIEYQLSAAQQLHRPQLDLVSGVQLNGLGDDLFDTQTGALPDLVNTDDVGWNVGFEFSMPIGFQREKLNVRYLRLLLSKARMARSVQEKEIRHEITFTSKTLDKWNQSLEIAKQRLSAAERRQAAVESEFHLGRSSLDLLLRAQDSVALSQTELARATAELAKAQLDFLYRQGLADAVAFP